MTVQFLATKDPADIDDWIFDLSTALLTPGAASNAAPAYDQIGSVVSVTSSPAGLQATTLTLATGAGGANTAAGFWLSGGVAGTQYLLTVLVQTTGGRTFSRSVGLLCQTA